MSTKATAPVRGRPRSEASRGSIIAAANQLLRSVGLRRMTVEAVAELSGVGKATIYRWWSSKGTLALDAYLEDMRSKVVVPNTGVALRTCGAMLKRSSGFIQARKVASSQSSWPRPKVTRVWQKISEPDF